MECALEDMTMDHGYAVEELKRIAKGLELQGKLNIVVDEDLLEIRYDEEEKESVKVTE